MPTKLIKYIDNFVVVCLPPDSIVKRISLCSTICWINTAKIQAEQLDGILLTFILKVTHTDNKNSILYGEFISTTAIY